MDARTNDRIRDSLLTGGVSNLKDFGYPGVNKKNILTDMVYKKLFMSMLESDENKTDIKNIEEVRQQLLKELGANQL